MNKYYYIVPRTKAPILIYAKRRPSIYTMPKSDTWVVREWDKDGWYIPCFPEITWNILEKLDYIGRIKCS